ncbi:MAG: 4Fe-4S binding protein [candidate division Zixibacteria bacterium]|nr:4Fe-4S binding protein [candidate division Zixibacteria bacterium]
MTRFWIQLGFVLLCLWIGIEFYSFIRFLETAGLEGSAYRPPGVEGFLPISSLMSLYLFAISGDIHPVHPAGFFILLAAVVVSFLFRKSFCSWICPFGWLSELLGDIGEKLFKRKLKLPRWLDYPLRSLKYLLLAFFGYSIFFLMTEASLRAFLDSPYNITADIKMYYFFADISMFSLVTLVILFFISIPIRNFWCRYLCPYGALLGIISLISPVRIKRNLKSCIDCGECAKACPSLIKVDQIKTVVSDECTTCLNCINVCPVEDTLELKSSIYDRVIPRKAVIFGVAGLFILVIGLGFFTGNWKNNIETNEYLRHQEKLHGYGHPTGLKDVSDYNKSITEEELEKESDKK